jgi:hypothetical protein
MRVSSYQLSTNSIWFRVRNKTIDWNRSFCLLHGKRRTRRGHHCRGGRRCWRGHAVRQETRKHRVEPRVDRGSPHQWRRNDSIGPGHEGSGGQSHSFHLRFLKPLRFRSTILEPNFHLSFGQFEGGREFCSFRDGEVLLLPKLLLQSSQLLLRERRSGFPVWLVLAKGADLDGTRRRSG